MDFEADRLWIELVRGEQHMAFDNDLSTTLMRDIEGYYDITVILSVLSSHTTRHELVGNDHHSRSETELMSEINTGNSFLGGYHTPSELSTLGNNQEHK